MPTEGEEAVANIAARLAGVPAALERLPRRPCCEAAAARPRRRPAPDRSRSPSSATLDRAGRGDNFFPGLVAPARRGRRAAARELRPAAPAAATRGHRRVRPLPARRAGPARPGEGGRRPRALRAGLALLPRRHGRPRGDLRLGLRGARTGSRPRCARSPTRSSPGGTVDEAVAALDADPARTHRRARRAFRDWMQELADRAIAELARHPLRHPRADPPHRVLHRPDQRRRHLLHRPERGLHPPGRMWWAVPRGHRRRSPPGARSPPSTTRACPATTSRSPRPPYRAELLNRWQRLMCWVSGHGEGWALYAERLMDELGYLDDPGDKLGMLDGQALPGRPGDRRHRHAPGAGDPARTTRSASTRASAGRRSSGWSSCAQHCRMEDEHPALRDQPLPRLARPGAVVQGRRADLAAGPRRRQGPHGAAFDLKAFHRAALDLGLARPRPAAPALARL